ncbi:MULTISPECIES: hypothetical protein [Pantoea]|jgi:hypothetical protein|uniref:hypothetical protein n=1 Tax=Pantoea TaxID=53335 RepID=UPI000682371A|nr:MULTISPECIES: hypothetical protein [Pantoea]KNH32268.1 hypothetical protein ACS76_10195 [Pantoea vagans]MBD8119096.1 hypothetical protein [Pantoea agglomerans]MBD8253044.1 hypothetical protein [Pantoea agglomerans]MDN4623554.1 hypothetical protein [Pantoea agglomerans]NQS81150.1 hypothetical protein [Pantoea agglomerans]
MKLLISLLISVVVMILFCISATFILRLSAYLFVGGNLLFSLEDVKRSATTGSILGIMLSFGVFISNKLARR